MGTPADRPIPRATASAPGACGELAQGILDDIQLQVTCPIDLYSAATVELTEGRGQVFGPTESPKACRAAELVLAHSSTADLDVHLHLESPLPRGKGMSSSTADVLAAAGATASALGVALSPHQQAELALEIEPSDGLMFSGIALFDHRGGRTARSLGQAPGMYVLVLDFGEALDTLAFNTVDHRVALAHISPQFRMAVDMITEGVAHGDVSLIGKGATLDARAYQRVLSKPQLEVVLAFSRWSGAVGVNVAHSGTVIGVLLDGDHDQVAWTYREAAARLKGLHNAYLCRLAGGGVTSGIPKLRGAAQRAV